MFTNLMSNKLKIEISVLFFLVLIFIFLIKDNLFQKYKSFLDEKRKIEITKNFEISKNLNDFFNARTEFENKLIAHAGGSVSGEIYTNSLEAVNKSILNGFKLIELDLLVSKDNKLISLHDWGSFLKKTNCCQTENVPISHNMFMDQKYSGLKVIDFELINEIFSNNNELILVTDKTNNFDLINQQLTFDKSRIIVEIFGRKNYFNAIISGIKNPMLSVRASDIPFVRKYNVKLVAVHSNELEIHKEKFSKLKKEDGVFIFVYSTNDINFIKKNKVAATAFYTDFLSPKRFVCEEKKCTTY